MSKKNLTKPLPKRQLTSDEMDAFIRGDAGKDTDKQISLKTVTQKNVENRKCPLNGRLATGATSALQDRVHSGGHEDE